MWGRAAVLIVWMCSCGGGGGFVAKAGNLRGRVAVLMAVIRGDGGSNSVFAMARLMVIICGFIEGVCGGVNGRDALR